MGPDNSNSTYRTHIVDFPCGERVLIHEYRDLGFHAVFPIATPAIKQHMDGTVSLSVRRDSAIVLRDFLNKVFPPLPPSKSNVVRFPGPSVSEQFEAELEPRKWDGGDIGKVLRHSGE